MVNLSEIPGIPTDLVHAAAGVLVADRAAVLAKQNLINHLVELIEKRETWLDNNTIRDKKNRAEFEARLRELKDVLKKERRAFNLLKNSIVADYIAAKITHQ